MEVALESPTPFVNSGTGFVYAWRVAAAALALLALVGQWPDVLRGAGAVGGRQQWFCLRRWRYGGLFILDISNSSQPG